MSNLEYDNDASMANFTAGWRIALEEIDWITVTHAVIGLTNFGERPVQSTRLADVLGRSTSEAEALARRWGWPGTQVEDGLVSVNPERARTASRRQVQVGDRRFGVTGCAGDIFLYAPLVRPSLLLDEICPVTGRRIRIVFIANRVEHIEPSTVVVPIPLAQELERTAGMHIEDIDADL
jgi:alkylmercury lyase